jgi:hypothetical protein
MIEWHNCTRCKQPCSIVPLSILFDKECKKYGGVWYCQFCRVYYTNHFLSYEQIQELKEKQISVEKQPQEHKVPENGTLVLDRLE